MWVMNEIELTLLITALLSVLIFAVAVWVS